MISGIQDRDFTWFVKHYDELQKKYGDRFLAIKGKTVIGDYSTYAEAVRETKKTEKQGTFIVQECRGDGRPYRVSIASMDFT